MIRTPVVDDLRPLEHVQLGSHHQPHAHSMVTLHVNPRHVRTQSPPPTDAAQGRGHDLLHQLVRPERFGYPERQSPSPPFVCGVTCWRYLRAAMVSTSRGNLLVISDSAMLIEVICASPSSTGSQSLVLRRNAGICYAADYMGRHCLGEDYWTMHTMCDVCEAISPGSHSTESARNALGRGQISREPSEG
ncbi:hypothetical protein DL764_007434 [Monosporascus ibericus]|uniref:Uncharacterized protein n=1 Tax=Monosporascus ibericus TaxID=155417 RepID=A0A4Q4T0U7_9PEZI|nr:hypothetical protein DL764_007434 [Monosporascus ibericus]